MKKIILASIFSILAASMAQAATLERMTYKEQKTTITGYNFLSEWSSIAVLNFVGDFYVTKNKPNVEERKALYTNLIMAHYALTPLFSKKEWTFLEDIDEAEVIKVLSTFGLKLSNTEFASIMRAAIKDHQLLKRNLEKEGFELKSTREETRTSVHKDANIQTPLKSFSIYTEFMENRYLVTGKVRSKFTSQRLGDGDIFK